MPSRHSSLNPLRSNKFEPLRLCQRLAANRPRNPIGACQLGNSIAHDFEAPGLTRTSACARRHPRRQLRRHPSFHDAQTALRHCRQNRLSPLSAANAATTLEVYCQNYSLHYNLLIIFLNKSCSNTFLTKMPGSHYTINPVISFACSSGRLYCEDRDLCEARYLRPSRCAFFRRPTRVRRALLLLQRQDQAGRRCRSHAEDHEAAGA